jgi:hypothetical protein
MQRGLIVEDGTHEQLLRINGVYARLYRRQFEEMASLRSRRPRPAPPQPVAEPARRAPGLKLEGGM